MATSSAEIRQVSTIKIALNSSPELTTTGLRDSPFVFGRQNRPLHVDLEANERPIKYSYKPGAPEMSQNEGGEERPTAEEAWFREGDDGSFKVEEESCDDETEEVVKADQESLAKPANSWTVFQSEPTLNDEDPTPGSPNAILIRHLEDLVTKDMAADPTQRVDMVFIGPEPWNMHLKALDGISPTHLKAWSGWDETVVLDGLSALATPWNLQSLEIYGAFEGFAFYYPPLFSQLKSLTLDTCGGFEFQTPHPLVSLTHLNLVEGTALNAFVHASQNIPGFNERLTTLRLVSTEGCDLNCFSIETFAQHLSQCVAFEGLDTYHWCRRSELFPSKQVRVSRKRPRSVLFTGTSSEHRKSFLPLLINS